MQGRNARGWCTDIHLVMDTKQTFLVIYASPSHKASDYLEALKRTGPTV